MPKFIFEGFKAMKIEIEASDRHEALSLASKEMDVVDVIKNACCPDDEGLVAVESCAICNKQLFASLDGMADKTFPAAGRYVPDLDIPLFGDVVCEECDKKYPIADYSVSAEVTP